MLIKRVSPISGPRELEIDITQYQYDAWYKGGVLIQNAMPNISADEREFIMTGIYPGEWDLVVPSDYNF